MSFVFAILMNEITFARAEVPCVKTPPCILFKESARTTCMQQSQPARLAGTHVYTHANNNAQAQSKKRKPQRSLACTHAHALRSCQEWNNDAQKAAGGAATGGKAGSYTTPPLLLLLLPTATEQRQSKESIQQQQQQQQCTGGCNLLLPDHMPAGRAQRQRAVRRLPFHGRCDEMLLVRLRQLLQPQRGRVLRGLPEGFIQRAQRVGVVPALQEQDLRAQLRDDELPGLRDSRLPGGIHMPSAAGHH